MKIPKHIPAFTLIEILIALILIGILSTLLFQTYTTITQIALKIENEKIMQTETLFALQTIQNLADRNTIDYDYYITGRNLENNTLTNTRGRVDILALSWQDGRTTLSSTGDCQSSIGWTGKSQPACWLVLWKYDEPLLLIDPSKIVISSLIFNITPIVPADQLYISKDITLTGITSPGFWIFADIKHAQYRTTRTHNISLFIQQFFSL